MSEVVESEFQALGDGMSPLIRAGDTVRLQPDQSLSHGDIVAVSMDGLVLIRRIFRSGALVSLLPENPDYEAIAWEPGMALKVLGRVTHVLHPLGV